MQAVTQQGLSLHLPLPGALIHSELPWALLLSELRCGGYVNAAVPSPRLRSILWKPKLRQTFPRTTSSSSYCCSILAFLAGLRKHR